MRLAMYTIPRVSKSLDDIRSQLFGFVDSVQDDFAARGFLPIRLNLNKGIVRGLLECFAWGQWQLYNLLQRLLAQASPYYATGEWLNLHADAVNLTRRCATQAVGNVRLFRAEGTGDGNINIPSGRIFRTKPDGAGEVYRYSNPSAAVLLAGTDFVDVSVMSESYGASANVSAGQICEFATPITGIARVANQSGWLASEGANEESDAELAHRYSLAWRANNGCTKYAYESWALEVAGVRSVSILDRHPRGQGTVDIVVRGADVLPTESLLEKVRAAIAPRVPINDDWLVKSPEAINISLEATLECTTTDFDRVHAEALQRVYALFAEESPIASVRALQIGQDVTLSLLTHTLMAVSGVKRVVWQHPAQDVQMPQML